LHGPASAAATTAWWAPVGKLPLFSKHSCVYLAPTLQHLPRAAQLAQAALLLTCMRACERPCSTCSRHLGSADLSLGPSALEGMMRSLEPTTRSTRCTTCACTQEAPRLSVTTASGACCITCTCTMAGALPPAHLLSALPPHSSLLTGSAHTTPIGYTHTHTHARMHARTSLGATVSTSLQLHRRAQCRCV